MKAQAHLKTLLQKVVAARHCYRAVCLFMLLVFISCDAWGTQGQTRLSLAQRAEKAQAAGSTDNAMNLYREALRQSPDWTEGWWRYGSLLYESKQYGAAENAFARLTELAPGNSLGWALLGLCEFEQFNWSDAELHLNEALNHGGLPAAIAHVSAYDLGLTLLRLKNREGAILVFRMLMQQVPDYPNLTLALGAAELGLFQVPSPADSVFPATRLAGEGAVDVLKDQPRAAEKLYRELITQFPSLPFAHLCLALFLESEHRDNEAAKQLIAETKVNPNDVAAWLWLSRVALIQQNAKLARSAAARARTLDPGNPLTFLVDGRSYMLEHNWRQALLSLLEAEKLAPQSSEVHFSLASTYAALHQVQAAQKERKLFLKTYGSGSPAGGSNSQ